MNTKHHIAQNSRAIPALPDELFLDILDQLVASHGTRDEIWPASHPITKTLRSLTLVSRFVYPYATRYLYSKCLHICNCANFACIRRTLGLDLGMHPQVLKHGQASRNELLFTAANPLPHITSAFLSPYKSLKNNLATPLVRLPHIIDLCRMIGYTLRRLILDLLPIYASKSDMEKLNPWLQHKSIFCTMSRLEDLVVSYNVVDYFRFPPPNLKRLAITAQEIDELPMLEFCFSLSSLEKLVFLRPPELSAANIENFFGLYRGKALDIVLVDVYANHRTPLNTQSWTSDDNVRIWEADVATSFCGDEVDVVLCGNWIWTHGIDGTIWGQKVRRMASWDLVVVE